MNTVNILGIPINKTTMNETINNLSNIIDKPFDSLFHVCTVNPEMVMLAKKNRKFRVSLKNSNLIIPDGIGVVIGSKILNNPLPERVTGFDTIVNLLNEREEKQLPTKIYCLGAKEEVILKAVAELKNNYRYVEVLGFNNGYFEENSEKEKELVNKISNLKPDLLLVGLGAPRQENFIYKFKDRLNCKLAIGVGGTFDVLSGSVERAPEIFQKMNLEWLYRLVKEPKRIKRQLSIPLFIFEIMKVKFNKNGD